MGPTAPAPDDASRYDRRVTEIAAAAPLPVPPCPVCGAERAVPRFAIEGVEFRLVVCPDCGHGRLHPLPDPETLRGFYPAAYYGDLGTKFVAPVELLVRLVGARHVRFLASGLAPGSRVLDVGCGRGVLLASLADRGFEAHGIEISEDAARGADPRAEIRIAPDVAAAGYAPASFDAVIVWHVLEHMLDPVASLAAIHRLLRPGGRLVVAVPHFGSLQARWAGPAWFHLDLPRHVHHFPLSALRRLLEHSGFAIRSEHHFSLRQNPFGWIQSWLNRRNLPRNGLYTLLYHREAGSPPFDAATRRRLWAGLVLGALPALAATLVETALRSGATVHVVAERR